MPYRIARSSWSCCLHASRAAPGRSRAGAAGAGRGGPGHARQCVAVHAVRRPTSAGGAGTCIGASAAAVAAGRTVGALDASSRIVMQQLIVMQQQIVRLWRQHGFALVLVTHDVAEASALADRIVVLDHGKGGLGVAGPCRIRVRPGCRRWRRSRHRCCRVCLARHRCRSQLPRRRRCAMRHPARRRHRKPRRCNASPSPARVGLSSRDHTGPCAPFHPPPRATRGVAGGCVTPA